MTCPSSSGCGLGPTRRSATTTAGKASVPPHKNNSPICCRPRRTKTSPTTCSASSDKLDTTAQKFTRFSSSSPETLHSQPRCARKQRNDSRALTQHPTPSSCSPTTRNPRSRSRRSENSSNDNTEEPSNARSQRSQTTTCATAKSPSPTAHRSEEHTFELQ